MNRPTQPRASSKSKATEFPFTKQDLGTGKAKGKAKYWVEGAVTIPESLQRVEFLDVWKDWVPYFSYGKTGDLGPPLRAQLKLLNEMGWRDAIATLERSIARGYRGFELHTVKGQPLKSLYEQETDQLTQL